MPFVRSLRAFEQHGPGLPLATDLVRAEHVAERVAARLPTGTRSTGALSPDPRRTALSSAR
ncbi:creatininase family protein [Pseudonocardia sichuanensis]|uniref:creatininase family protein n=1 Tax=Pseudonocardia kunmingensis TaxID=630975 RepID=UPI001FEBE216|nr:creatininase family protein [Pseudonocardia kunmingensis]